MHRIVRLAALVVILGVPISVQAACRILDCDIEWGLFGDSCSCNLVGLTDYNGEPQSCAIRVHTVWMTIEPGYPKVPIEICECVFSHPCTSGPI